MSPWEFLNQRSSVSSKHLAEPGPDVDELAGLLALAVRVPDHGRLTPWRFIRIAGDARRTFGERLAALMLERDAGADPAKVEKERTRYVHAPLVLAVVHVRTAGHKVPEQEQLLSAGCACYNLLLGAQALGYGAQWLTGWPAYDREVASWLGLGGHEGVVGFIHIGTPVSPRVERARPAPGALLQDWQP